MKVLVTGATGYIGGRLVPRLLEAGYRVRVLVRDPEKLALRPWRGAVEVAVGDLLRPETLAPALEGCQAGYYLVHSMSDTADFEARDRQAARQFGEAAAGAGLGHLVYLGGILPEGTRSKHLASRAEVGEELARHVPTTEFRAGPIIGSGSASFEMVRYLTERLPVMVAPRWILNEVQPIGVRDVLKYLIAALEVGPSGVLDIGADRLTFREMMQRYGEVRGLHPKIFPVPVLAPTLAALWVGLVTPIPNSLAVPLVQGIVRPVVGDTEKARARFPGISPMPYVDAVALAVARTEEGQVETRWSGATNDAPVHRMEDREGLIREVHTVTTPAPPAEVYRSFASLGGARGWLVWRWAWWIRGILDQLVGGPGLRRGRRHPVELHPGEALDFWRVEAVDPGRRIRLRAEMKVPGRAWLQFEAVPRDEGGTLLVQTALFAPRGLAGFLYWYLLYPVHRFIFADMVAAVAKAAEEGR